VLSEVSIDFGVAREKRHALLHFDRINLDKARRSFRSTVRHCAKLVRASLVLVAIGGAATAGPFEDAVATYQRGDYATALRLWHPLAEQGDADAQFRLGVMYESGQGVLRSDAGAIKWYRKAAEQDDAVAQFNLGIMYAKGGSPNYAEAALWYRCAADHGLGGAQFNLGMMYAEGQGVPQDYVQAHMWLNLAAAQLPSLGTNQRNTTVDARDRAASKMTPQQICEAQQLAFEWTTEDRHVGQLRSLLDACTSTKKQPTALPSRLAKFRRSQTICRARQSPAALAFMVSCLRIGARSPLVER
jgi:tetratricopeptide (TPR) repeat protein